jgi:hypothetical protein
MSRFAVRIVSLLLLTVTLLAITPAASASVVLSYFELEQGSLPTEVWVRWGTESETNTAAFRIYRGTSADPAQATLVLTVPARGSAVSGADYEFLDGDLTRGQVYHYWLTELNTSGTQTTLAASQIMAGGAQLPRIYLPLLAIRQTDRGDGAPKTRLLPN